MIRCQKCSGKTVTVEARVHLAIGDNTMSTITDVGHCIKCNIQTMAFQCKIEPLQKQIPKGTSSDMEVQGNA
jgi:hypothetical protein